MSTNIFRPLRTFKRLEFAPTGTQSHPYFLPRLADRQLANKGSFTTGPMMYAHSAKDEYDYWETLQAIDHSMRYFMRPYRIVAFGCNEKDISKNYLLTRIWLQHENEHNSVIATVERVDLALTNEYMTALNYKTALKPTVANIMQAPAIRQTLIKTNEPYNGCWETTIEPVPELY